MNDEIIADILRRLEALEAKAKPHVPYSDWLSRMVKITVDQAASNIPGSQHRRGDQQVQWPIV